MCFWNNCINDLLTGHPEGTRQAISHQQVSTLKPTCQCRKVVNVKRDCTNCPINIQLSRCFCFPNADVVSRVAWVDLVSITLDPDPTARLVISNVAQNDMIANLALPWNVLL